MTTLLFFAFLSGIVTIFAPCIWPILPVILSASASGGHRKPLGIVLGISVSFTFFTLALASLLKIIPFDPDSLRLFGAVIIAFLGVVLLVPALGSRLEAWVSRLTTFGGRFLNPGSTGFGSGFTTGFALGIVWSPCAGPILATVATLAATQAVNAYVVLITVAYVIGVGIPLFIFALLGQKILTRTRVLSPYTARIQQIFGVIMILAALAIYSGYDRVLQTKILTVFPSYDFLLNGFEKSTAVQEGLQSLVPNGAKKVFQEVQSGLNNYGPAPEFNGITTWLNTDGKPLTLQSLRGKVVLIDFWTYSCINCIRTLPYVTAWYDKYKKDGLVVVGVHTPEFEFEKKTSNVEAAIKQYNIHYPVAQDNNYATWQAYNNRYWPAHYLIDAEGNIRSVHFGEGNYQETEEAIQALLKEAGSTMADTPLIPETASSGSFSETPEIYLGTARMDRFASSEKAVNGVGMYTIPTKLSLHNFAFEGEWTEENERALPGAGASLTLHFNAGKVFLVLAPGGVSSSTVKVFLDGKSITKEEAGGDVESSLLTVRSERLYEIVHLPSGASHDRTLRLEFETPGMAAYAFTFGE